MNPDKRKKLLRESLEKPNVDSIDEFDPPKSTLPTGTKVYSMNEDDDDWEDPFGIDTAPKLLPNQIISFGKTLTLNEGQVEALRLGKAFLAGEEINGRTWDFATIKGSAGSGKTTIAKAVLDKVYSVIVTAPTHKAKKIVSRSTGYKGETIQKILGMKPEVTLEDFRADNVLFAMSGKSLLGQYKIVLIDEASMLSKDLVGLLMDNAKQYGIKVIFLGDPRQLPPVGEGFGRVFSDKDILQISLTKVERQQVGNPLIELYDKILCNIDEIDEKMKEIRDTPNITPYKKMLLSANFDNIPYEFVSNMKEDGVGYRFIQDKKEFGSLILGHFKIGQDLDNKVICWSNDNVRSYNNSIRNNLLGSKDLPIQEGEFLMAYNTVTDPEDWRRVLYENSADYMVVKVSEAYRQAANFDEKLKYDIKGWVVTIEDIDNDMGSEKVFIVSQESYREYIEIEQTYSKFALDAKTNNKRWAWKQYYDFRNRFALMTDIRQYYKGIVKDPKKVTVDFDFGYAITIHKSQGSTYNNVFMVDDFYDNPNPAERWRLAYVGLSRPRLGAYILNSIAR